MLEIAILSLIIAASGVQVVFGVLWALRTNVYAIAAAVEAAERGMQDVDR